MKRREFLWMSSAAAGAMALDSLGCRSVGDVPLPERVLPGEESFLATTCLMCPAACGLKVRRVDGVPVGILGNPNHPLNAGGVCMEGLSGLQLLYHPDRQLRPLQRFGVGRDNALEPVSWDGALDELARRMGELREKAAPQKLAFVLGRTGGSMEALVRLFLTSWGSPHLLLDSGRTGCEKVFEVMHGFRARPAFDFDNAGLIVSFGADLLGAWDSPLQFQRASASLREPGRTLPGHLVVADARLSLSAARAREWVALQPGSHGALALGMAYVLLRERMYDEDFAARHLHGFEDFRDESGVQRSGYKSVVLREYSPEVVSRLSGVPVTDVLSLAKSFGENHGALAVFDDTLTDYRGGLYAAMAVHSLNLLKGNINRTGGVYLQPETPLAPLSSAGRPATGAPDPLLVEDLVEMGRADRLPDVLFLYHSNPVYSSPLGREMGEVLERIPWIVSFSPFLDETSRFVDLLLPESLPLERWEDRLFPAASPMPGWGIVQPCAEAAAGTRHAGDVLLQLAARLGGAVARSLPWSDFEELLKHRARGLFEAQAGTLNVGSFDQGLVSEMERRGWWMGGPASFAEFWQQLLETGAWLDPHFQVRGLADYSAFADGRIDLFSRTLLQRLAQETTAVDDLDCLPHHVDAATPSPDDVYPFLLLPFRPGKLGGGTSRILPWVLQSAGTLQDSPWESWAELHPSDAADKGIRQREWIWVESATGRIRVRALLSPGTSRGVVCIPCGQGHTAMGRWAAGRGANPLELMAGDRDPVSGLPLRFETRVKVYPA